MAGVRSEDVVKVKTAVLDHGLSGGPERDRLVVAGVDNLGMVERNTGTAETAD